MQEVYTIDVLAQTARYESTQTAGAGQRRLNAIADLLEKMPDPADVLMLAKECNDTFAEETPVSRAAYRVLKKLDGEG